MWGMPLEAWVLAEGRSGGAWWANRVGTQVINAIRLLVAGRRSSTFRILVTARDGRLGAGVAGLGHG